jgi:hypothetical protein
MAPLEVKSFDRSEETRSLRGQRSGRGGRLAGQIIGRGTFEPVWKWSDNVKPISGRMRVPR